MYGTFAKEGIISSVSSYYYTGNGRWVLNVLDSFFIKIGRISFVIMIPVFLLLLCILIYKIAARVIEKNNILYYYLTLLLVSSFNIYLCRETTYWFTGFTNYLFPAVFFLAVVASSLYVFDIDVSVEKKVIFSLLCLISCGLMEQFALMTIGWIILWGGCIYIREKQIHYWYIAVTVVSCFILTFVIFAPGNFIRTEAATLNESQNITQKILDLVYANYYSEVSFKLVTVISIFEGVFLFRYSKFISLFAWINVTILTTFGNDILFWRMKYVIFSLLFFVITTFYTCIKMKQKNKIITIILIILALGSQIMLLVSQVWGYRTTYPVVIINVLFSISLFDALLMNHKEYLLLGIGIYVNQYFSPQTILLLLVFVAMLSLCKSSMVKHFVWAISACIMITLNLFPTYVGYRENEIIHKKNNESIASGLHNNSDSIYILAYIDDRFGWMSPPLSEFHEGYLRKYYGITSEIVITYNKNIF